MLHRRTALVRRATARELARAAGRRVRSAARWLAAAERAIRRGSYRSDYRRRLLAFAAELAARALPWELAVFYLADQTAAALEVTTRSCGTYRAELTRLGLLHTVREGSTPGVRAAYRWAGAGREAGNQAAVLLFTTPLSTELSTRPSSVEEGSRRGEPTREAGQDQDEPAAPAQPRPNPRDRRGRSRRLAAELRDAVPELEPISVAAVATVLRQHAVDRWTVDDLRLALGFRPGWEPWTRDGSPVRRPAGWLAYRLRAWAGGLAPAQLRRRLEEYRNPAGVERRAAEAAAQAAAVPMPAAVRERAAELRAARAELRAREDARQAAERDRLRAWALRWVDAENPWPATR